MKTTLLLSTLILISSIDTVAQVKVVGSTKTNIGVLRIAKIEEGSFTVALNGKIVERDGVSYFDGDVITNEENAFVSFGQHITVDDAEVIFLNLSEGGSASGTFNRIITVWKDGAISISPYIGNGAIPRITRQKKSLIIYFPAVTTIEGRMAADKWMWLNGKTKRVRPDSNTK